MNSKKLISILFFVVSISNCFLDGTSPRDKCKDGDPGGTSGKRPDRDFYCSMVLLSQALPNARNLPGDNSFFLTLCVDAQIKLNDCDSRTTLPIGIGDVK